MKTVIRTTIVVAWTCFFPGQVTRSNSLRTWVRNVRD